MNVSAVPDIVSQSNRTGYRPGACNIGTRQRRQRYRLAGVALLGAAAYLALVGLSDAPTVLTLGTFVPFSLGVEWYLQGRRSFCATLGFAGRYAFEASEGSVTDSEAVRADRRYAFRLTLLGLLGGALLAVGAYATLVAV